MTCQQPKVAAPAADIRFMVRSDLGRIAELEALCYLDPWDENRLYHFLKQPVTRLGQIVEWNETIVGYALYSLRATAITIDRLGVSPLHRRASVASSLVVKLKSKLSQDRRRVVNLQVRETNLGAQVFLRAHQFRAIKLDRGAYRDTGEDGISFAFQVDVDGRNS